MSTATATATNGTSNAVALQNPITAAVKTLREMVEKSRPELMAALPKGVLSAERLGRIVLTECQRNPELLECHPRSIIACMIQSAQLGLEPGAQLGHAYLIPYRNKNNGGAKEAQFQIGYKGLIALAHRSGKVSAFFAHTVYSNDEFDIELGSSPRLFHKPSYEDRGQPFGYYAVVKYKDGGDDFEFMTHAQMAAHRARYSKSNGGPWNDAFEEMAKKTVIRRLCKRVPISTELAQAANNDEAAEITIGEMTESKTEQLRNRLRGQEQLPGVSVTAEGEIPNDPAPLNVDPIAVMFELMRAKGITWEELATHQGWSETTLDSDLSQAQIEIACKALSRMQDKK